MVLPMSHSRRSRGNGVSGDEEMDVEIEGPGAAFPGKINFLISVRYSAHCTVNIMQPCSSLYEVIVERIGIGGPRTS